jgi:hypothetical protein
MKRVFLAATALLAIWASAQLAKADTVDPLHMFCSNCTGDNGTFNPFPSGGTVNNMTVDESGTSGGLPATDFFLKVLLPVDNLLPPTLVTEQFTGTLGGNAFTGTASAFATSHPATGDSAFLFVSGVNGSNNPSLEGDFIGLTTANGSPPNRLDTFLGSTQGAGIDPNAVGFLVLTLDLGAFTVPENGHLTNTSPFTLSSTGNLPAGTWILGDACVSGTLAAGTCSDVTTATSAALFATPFAAPVPGPIVGSGIPGLFGLGMLWLGRLRQKRNGKRA